MAKILLKTKEDYKEAVEELFQILVSINASEEYNLWFEEELHKVIEPKWWHELMERTAILKEELNKEDIKID